MQVDVEPELTPAQQRSNVLMLGAEMTLFMGSLGLIAPLTLVPLFVSKLTDSPQAIGVLTAAFQIGWFPALFTAGHVEAQPRKLPAVLFFGVLERLPVLLLPIAALLSTSLSLPLVLALIYLARFGQSAVGGIMMIPWAEVLARSVPAEQRGRFMGLSSTAGYLLGAAAAAMAAPMLEWLPFPTSFVVLFGVGSLIMAASFAPLLYLVEPPGPPPREASSMRQHLAELPAALRADPAFSRYLGGLSLAALGTMGASFLVVYGVGRLGATDELAGWYTVAVLMAQVFGNLGLGWLADRHDFRITGLASAVSALGLSLLVLVVADPLWLLGSFVLLGVNQAALMMARFAAPMDFAPPDRRPTYMALMNASQGLALAVGPLVAGQLVAELGYQWLFSTCLGLSVLGALAMLVRAPRPAAPDTSAG
jgi:MFS family permease